MLIQGKNVILSEFNREAHISECEFKRITTVQYKYEYPVRTIRAHYKYSTVGGGETAERDITNNRIESTITCTVLYCTV
jgi:hypothetical protein